MTALNASTLRLAILIGASLLTAAAAAQETYRGFTHCAPPTRPACIATAPRGDAGCDNELAIFITATYRYRECLTRETERAVRDANDAILAWRGQAARKK